MIISPRVAGSMNIGHRMTGANWVVEKWNPRYSQAQATRDQGLPCSGGKKWLMRLKTTSIYMTGHAKDSDRNWTTPYQDLLITFNSKMQDGALTPGSVATGHTISINGSPQTTNYQSGSGGAYWIMRIPVLVDADDVITYSYNPAVGNTTAVDNSLELSTASNVAVNNLLTRRIRFTLKGADNNPVMNQTVKLAVFLYNSGNVDNLYDNIPLGGYEGGTWMRRQMIMTATTDANGVLDVKCSCGLTVGTTVYIVVYRPNVSPTESFAWTLAVQ